MDSNSNLVSIGNHILHLIGNLSRHIISGLGGEQYTRDREREFTNKSTFSKAGLLEKLTSIVEHFAYHVGQIAFAVMYRRVGYAKGVDLSRQNAP